MHLIYIPVECKFPMMMDKLLSGLVAQPGTPILFSSQQHLENYSNTVVSDVAKYYYEFENSRY